MNPKTRLVLRETAFTVVAFMVAVYLLYVVAVWGMQDFLEEGPLKEYVTNPAVHVELLLSGLLFGGLVGLINRWTDSLHLRRRPVGQIVLIRTVLYVVGLTLVIGLIFAVVSALVLPWDTVVELFAIITPRYVLVFLLWLSVTVATINLMLELERILGFGNLWRIFVGRYRRPERETRVFAMLDLKGSTTIAERLGDQRYSQLLQDCYSDLTPVVLQYGASILQYVGDEVLLTWNAGRGRHGLRASVRASLGYQERLAQRRTYYLEQFGIEPIFRAGIAVGPVTVTEVGDVKRQIVYNGDVLNTAARLLELCKDRNDRLVVSDAVGEGIADDADIRTTWREVVELRGKQDLVEAIGLEPAASASFHTT